MHLPISNFRCAVALKLAISSVHTILITMLGLTYFSMTLDKHPTEAEGEADSSSTFSRSRPYRRRLHLYTLQAPAAVMIMPSRMMQMMNAVLSVYMGDVSAWSCARRGAKLGGVDGVGRNDDVEVRELLMV